MDGFFIVAEGDKQYSLGLRPLAETLGIRPKKDPVAEGDEHLLLPFRERDSLLTYSQGGGRSGLTLGYMIRHLRRQSSPPDQAGCS